MGKILGYFVCLLGQPLKLKFELTYSLPLFPENMAILFLIFLLVVLLISISITKSYISKGTWTLENENKYFLISKFIGSFVVFHLLIYLNLW